jgi:hypothetical protein
MGDNLPPGVSISDSDAPWNDTAPNPEDCRVICPDCDWSGTVAESDYDEYPFCPECGAKTDPY